MDYSSEHVVDKFSGFNVDVFFPTLVTALVSMDFTACTFLPVIFAHYVA